MTTKADTSVKWFHSGTADAPVLSGQAGKLIELLDACLINGFSTRTPDSIVVADGVATVSISAGNPYEKHAVVVISGASNAGLNAEWRIATSSASSFTFACPGVANGTVTGASVKRAAAGWGKPFSDTNVAVYQSLDPNSTQLYLRVNDADARYARVRGYEQMTDANTGTGLFPTAALIDENSYTWLKSTTTGTLAREWTLVSDDLFFWFLPRGENTHGATPNMFGDFFSFVAGDKYNAIITAHASAAPTDNKTNHPTAESNETTYYRYVARQNNHTGGAVGRTLFAVTPMNNGVANNRWDGGSTSSVPLGFGAYGAELLGGPVLVPSTNTSGSDYRGILPGVRTSLFRETLPARKVVETTDGGAFLKIATAPSRASNGVYDGVTHIDILGPWR